MLLGTAAPVILLVEALRRAALKPARGKVGPRIHDLRHSMVCNRMLIWYRDGVNPQSKLPHLAIYLGHKDINSTLVYLTVTQEQMRYAQRAIPSTRRRSARHGRRTAMKVSTLAYLLHAFFHEWLAQQRNLSHHTVSSYRDTWRLFLRFVAARSRRSVSDLAIEHLMAEEVLAFLRHSEEERKVTDRNPKLSTGCAAQLLPIRRRREPLALAQCAEILRIPTKKAPTAEVNYLEADEVTAILKQPDRSTLEGQRDHALLALLYNTGARIQEALDLCPRSRPVPVARAGHAVR